MSWGHNSVVEHWPTRGVEGIGGMHAGHMQRNQSLKVLGNDSLALLFSLPSIPPFLFRPLFPFTGGNGYINDFPMGRFLRDAKLYEIGAGTSEVRRLVIGRAFNADFR